MEKQDYSVIELIHNDSFRRIIEGSANVEEREYWNNWMEASESNRQKIQEALSEITGFRFTDPSEKDFEDQWARLYDQTIGNTSTTGRKARSVAKSSKIEWMFRAVAAVLLIAAVGAVIHMYKDAHNSTELAQISKRKTVTTNAREQKILKFRNDGKEAKIVMNSNSSLTHDIGLLKNKTVTVNLEGEAFFAVEEGFSEPPAFSVTTPYGVVEDIGTVFLITVSAGKSRVILQEGLVNVTESDGKTLLKRFQVAKGELIEFNNDEILSKSKVNSTFYTSWATGYIEFDQTKISAFADFIESRFGATVKIVDPTLADVTVDGAAYFSTLEGIVRYVSDVLEIPAYQSASGDTVFIGRQYGE